MAPVGSYESLMAAIQGGADSIYFGIEGLNMRSRSSNNFTTEDLHKIVAICKENGIKSYLTVNTVIYGEDLSLMRTIIDAAKEADVSAIIASDVAPMSYARSIGVEVHLSTQLNISNVEALKFYALFADVVVLARELNLEQVSEIFRQIQEQQIKGPNGQLIRIEMFAHGALCMAVSGKCYLSLHEMNASANRGACMQICRRGYTVKDKESNIELDIDNQYIMSPKDLKTMAVMYIDRTEYNMKRNIRLWFQELLELLFQSAALVIDTIRTFFLIALSILGPIAFALSVYDGFQSTLTQWITRYISIYMWLPVSDLFSSVLARIQVLMLTRDIEAMSDPTFIPDSSNTVYIIFLIIGIFGYFTIPTVANWIIMAGGVSHANRAMNQTATKVGNVAAAGAGAAVGNIAGKIIK